ncbi:heparan-alpha-glucosaminide N-acetyltransferase domain-containing protein [Leucobacter sp. NPDC077196]|uniref:heparan-alpha-glucosaminide N-acetyltransferase domain-containing protein n=1 Tax=Leucobacter sp. NPDC077196 TaxID=3154959 RepID=UPI003412F54F
MFSLLAVSENNGIAILASHLRAQISRLEPPHRLAGVDLARGLAVIGVFAAHLAVISSLEWDDPGTWSGLVEGRSAVLFAMLAGVSIGIIAAAARRREARGVSAPRPLWGLRTQLLLRGILLWLLGIWLDDLDVPVYVILPAYGALFVLAIPFTRLAVPLLFVISAVLAVGAPFVVWWINAAVARSDDPVSAEESLRLIAWNYPLPLWLAFMLCGMATGALLMR